MSVVDQSVRSGNTLERPFRGAIGASTLTAAALIMPMVSTGGAFPIVHEWTNQSLSGHISDRSAGAPIERAIPTAPESTADRIKFVHETSGLTWEQLGRLFGVSRRSVHAWAAGARLSAANAERLARVSTVVIAHRGASPEQTRARLISPADGSPSPFDSLRQSWSRGPIMEDTLTLYERLGIADA